MELSDLIFDFIIDKKKRINTTGRIEPFELDIYSERIQHYKAYQATPYRLLAFIEKNLPVDPTQYNFIDVGVGKGRALLYFGKLPFKSLMGVEISAQLVRDFYKNFKNLDINLTTHPQIYQGDILNFDLPMGPNLFFLYNPFDGLILKEFLNKHKEIDSNRDIFIYVNPIRDFVFEMNGYSCIGHFQNENPNKTIKLFTSPKSM